MLVELMGGTVVPAAGVMAYAVRSRSSRVFGPSVWRGPRDRNSIALTFDDGPSETTQELLAILSRHDVRATFFQCGANVRRLPGVAREVAGSGHEIGNHSDTHTGFWFRSPKFIRQELRETQKSIFEVTGFEPRLFRAPFGARWFGLRQVQAELDLLGVMWTVLGRDWTLPAPAVAERVLAAAANGTIICLHDGRELRPDPDIRATLDAVRRLIPELKSRGYTFETVSELCLKN